VGGDGGGRAFGQPSAYWEVTLIRDLAVALVATHATLSASPGDHATFLVFGWVPISHATPRSRFVGSFKNGAFAFF